jgi:hypothetical protein
MSLDQRKLRHKLKLRFQGRDFAALASEWQDQARIAGLSPGNVIPLWLSEPAVSKAPNARPGRAKMAGEAIALSRAEMVSSARQGLDHPDM